MGRRILNEALSKMVNAERRGFASTNLQPISSVMVSFLNVMKYRGYVKDFEVLDLHRVGKITVELQGRIKECKALTYRQDLMAKEIEKYRRRMLPTQQTKYWYGPALSVPAGTEPASDWHNMVQWGYVVLTTPNGVLDHEEAIKQNVGGQVLGYFH